jgi:hypothetical protein
MRRGRAALAAAAVAVFLAGSAGVAEPEEAAPAAAPGLVLATPPVDDGYRPYEARLNRGGFIEFGARLAQRRPNSLYTCRTLSGTNFNNCSMEAINFYTGETFQPPAGLGRITQIRVRVGTQGTGPMRVDVVEALRPETPTGRVCCRLVRRSQIFTPAQGRITTINTNLPIFQSPPGRPNGNGFYVDQRLELTMLNGNVPIPAQFDNVNTPSTLTGWHPGWQRVGQERTGPAGYSGAMVLLRARWRPA